MIITKKQNKMGLIIKEKVMKLFSVIIFCILSISLHANCIPELKRELRTYNKGLDLKRSFETKQELINKMGKTYQVD